MRRIELLDMKQPLDLNESILKTHLAHLIQSKGQSTYFPIATYFPSPLMLRSSVLDHGGVKIDRHQLPLLDEAILAFLNSIQLAWSNPFINYLIQTDLAYSLETCAGLLIESFTNPKKPQLTPPILLPPREKCAQLMETHVSTLPWKFQNWTEAIALRKQESKFIFEIHGERGDLEKRIETADRTEGYWMLFGAVMQFQYHLDNYRRVFDATAILPQ